MRTPRFTRPGAFYHITARTNHKDKLLASPLAKTLFMETLELMRQKHDCLIVNFQVMDNHIHLIMRPQDGTTLSACMKRLLGVYSMRYDRVFKTWGTVWGGRFFSRPISGIGDMANTIAYVDNNPVRAFLANSPEKWEWGGLFVHQVGREDILGPPPPWVVLIAPSHSRRVLTSGRFFP